MSRDRDPGARGRSRRVRAAAALERFERAAGLYRPGRSPWVWIGPGINLVGSFAMVMWVGIVYDLGWAATIPTAFFLALFMGAMSAAFLATWEDDAEGDEREAAEALAPPPAPPAAGPEHGARVPSPSPAPAAPRRAEASIPAAQRQRRVIAPETPPVPVPEPVGPRGRR